MQRLSQILAYCVYPHPLVAQLVSILMIVGLIGVFIFNGFYLRDVLLILFGIVLGWFGLAAVRETRVNNQENLNSDSYYHKQ